MPRTVKEKIGEIHRVRTEKTFFDKVKEFFSAALAIGFIFMVLGLIVG